MADAIIRWSTDNWQTNNDTCTRNTKLDIYVADLSFSEDVREIKFTFFWKVANRWENKDFIVSLENSSR